MWMVVTGEDNRAPMRLKAVAERWTHRRMVHRECGNLHLAIVIHNSRLHDMGVDLRAGCGEFFGQVAPDVDVFRKELLYTGRKLRDALWAIQLERFAAAHNPGGTEEVGQVRRVIRM